MKTGNVMHRLASNIKLAHHAEKQKLNSNIQRAASTKQQRQAQAVPQIGVSICREEKPQEIIVSQTTVL